jgi:1-acyl-sn-glycerol-3-phosphate acyltransferase
MALDHWIVTNSIKGLTHVLCKIHADELKKVPHRGPLIIIANHINFIEVPILYTQLYPRPMVGFVKYESWDNPLLGYLFDLWGGIPVHRGEPDMKAFREGLRALRDGKIFVISPEGTRSGHGRLLQGQPGIAVMALMSGVPILPLVYYGHVELKNDLKKLKRTNFYIKVGCQFSLVPGNVKVTSEIRKEMTTEIMYQLAALLPHEMRGVYSDLGSAKKKYLRFLDGN